MKDKGQILYLQSQNSHYTPALFTILKLPYSYTKQLKHIIVSSGNEPLIISVWIYYRLIKTIDTLESQNYLRQCIWKVISQLFEALFLIDRRNECYLEQQNLQP